MGEIPPDAIVGGHDRNGAETYIGQAYIVSTFINSYSAIVPVEIHRGIASVDIPLFGVKGNTTTDIKVYNPMFITSTRMSEFLQRAFFE